MDNETLSLQIYSSGTTPIYDTQNELLNGRDLWWETLFPGGKYGAGGIFIPRDLNNNWWEVKGTQRVVIRSGNDVRYEGKIPNLSDIMSASDEGADLEFMGLWSFDLGSKNLRKRWADDRTDESTWPWQTGVSAADKVFIDRRERFKFVPKAETFAVSDYSAVRYTMPYDQTIKRIVFDYNLTGVAGENWTASVYDIDHTSTEWSVNQVGAGSSSGSVDIDSTADFTAMREIEIRFTATGGSTPASDGTTYLSITNLMVYSENEGANNISLESVANDIVVAWSEILNSSTAFIHTPTTERSLEPFISGSDSFEPLTSILLRAAAPGDGDDNRMSVGVLHSEVVGSPDGKPVLYTSEYPDETTGYDYVVSPDSKNLVGTLKITHDFEADLFNFIQVEYISKDGVRKYLDPNETTSLKDATSIASYGERHLLMRLGNQTAVTAQEIGEKWLAAKKEPPWLTSQIRVVGYILDADNQKVTTDEIAACDRAGTGKRLKVEWYDTFMISRVRNALRPDGSVVATINIGPIDDPLSSQQIFELDFDDSVRPSGVTDSGGSATGSYGIDKLLGFEKLKRKLNRSGRGAEWQRIKLAAQAARRAGGKFKDYKDYL